MPPLASPPPLPQWAPVARPPAPASGPGLTRLGPCAGTATVAVTVYPRRTKRQPGLRSARTRPESPRLPRASHHGAMAVPKWRRRPANFLPATRRHHLEPGCCVAVSGTRVAAVVATEAPFQVPTLLQDFYPAAFRVHSPDSDIRAMSGSYIRGGIKIGHCRAYPAKSRPTRAGWANAQQRALATLAVINVPPAVFNRFVGGGGALPRLCSTPTHLSIRSEPGTRSKARP